MKTTGRQAPKRRPIKAPEVVRLLDGTRTLREVADIMGVHPSYIRTTARRRGVLDKIKLVRPRKGGKGVKVLLRETEAKVAQLTPWAKVGMAVMQDWPEAVDIEGHWLQDVAEEAGVLIAVDGGFDPAIHHDPMGDAEAGDDWFMFIKRPVLE